MFKFLYLWFTNLGVEGENQQQVDALNKGDIYLSKEELLLNELRILDIVRERLITKKYIWSQEMEPLAIGDATCERDCFPKLFFEKQPLENKPYFYYGFLLTKNCG